MSEHDSQPVRRRLPPLTALRAFEAVARHLSVTYAADELAVTPAAVSQQVRQLEDVLGVALLRKQGRLLALTEAGRALQPGLSEAFDRMAQAMVDMRPRGETRPAVRLAVPPSFAECWLMPRLASFLGDHPGCDIHVSAGTELVDFARDPVDLAVRFGIGRYPGLSVELLRGEEVFPVCAPALLEDGPPLKSVSDLRFHTLIHDEHQAEREVCPDWGMWLSAAGVHDVPFVSGPRFNQSSMALEAAAQGLGVALAKGLIAEGDLATGRLVRPLGEIQDLRFGYWIVSTPHALSRPEVRLLRDWLHAEVASSPISRPVFSARSANYEI